MKWGWERVHLTDDWPSLVPVVLPQGKWLTIRRAPVPFLLLQPRGRALERIRAYVGVPIPLAPGVQYELVPAALLTAAGAVADGFNVVAGVGQTYVDRRIEAIVSEAPMPGGLVHLRAFVITQTTQASARVLTLTTDGSRTVNVRTYQGSGDNAQLIATPETVDRATLSPSIATASIAAGSSAVLAFSRENTIVYNVTTYGHAWLDEMLMLSLTTTFAAGTQMHLSIRQTIGQGVG